MMNILPVLALACAGVLYTLCRMGRQNLLLATTGIDGDEDIKIAPGHFSQSPRAEDAAELAAEDFLRQKRSGNVELARELGSRYARALLQMENGPLAGELKGKPQTMWPHIFLLYSYVVNHVIADHSPNSILAQTSLNVFYKDIEAASPELYRYVSDMAAFSLYILCERSRNRSDEEIGMIFAGLAGSDSDTALVRYGNELYDKLYAYCIGEIRGTPYEDA